MFAEQCAATIENTRITIELRAAYERQKELDVLKDQFIMMASHELRTPLTAVLGYIELLAEYNVTLDADTRADFIAKAHRGCDELTLMVNNIIDANRVKVDVDNAKIIPVSLQEKEDRETARVFPTCSRCPTCRGDPCGLPAFLYPTSRLITSFSGKHIFRLYASKEQ